MFKNKYLHSIIVFILFAIPVLLNKFPEVANLSIGAVLTWIMRWLDDQIMY